jgi:hypothetical protein
MESVDFIQVVSEINQFEWKDSIFIDPPWIGIAWTCHVYRLWIKQATGDH